MSEISVSPATVVDVHFSQIHKK